MEKVYSRGSASPPFGLRSFSEPGRHLEQAAEGRRFQEMAAPGLVRAELQLREDGRRFGGPGGRLLAPQARQPVTQLAVAWLAVEDAPDHELGRDSAVPVVLLEAESDVEPQFLPEAIELATEAESDRAPRVARAVLDPEAEMLAVADRGDFAELAAGREQRDPGIAEPERSEARQLRAEVEGQLRAVDERIDHRHRKQLGFGQVSARVRGERRRERLDVRRLDREPGRRTMPSEANELARAGGQAGVQVEAPGRAARAFPLALPAGDQDDRPVVALDEPRGHDADHALVPLRSREHVAALPVLRLRPRLDLLDRLAEDPFLDRLTVAIELVEPVGQPAGLPRILGQQQLERGLRMAEPPGRVQSRGEAKADGGGVDGGRIDPGNRHQLAKPRLLRARERAQAGDREAAILVDERDDVGDRGDCDEVEMAKQRLGVRSQERLPELEDDSGPAKLAEWIAVATVGPDEGTFRQFFGRPVVVA